MSDTTVGLRRKISSAGDLKSVVRTMKAQAASSIEQYEMSVLALAEYYRNVELGLGLCFRELGELPFKASREVRTAPREVNAVVFGSDQGLVGQFNDVVADYAIEKLSELPGKPKVWAVGERVYARLEDTDFTWMGLFEVPLSIHGVTSLIGRILVEIEAQETKRGEDRELYLFYNRPGSGVAYAPVVQRLLPLDDAWRRDLAELPWPTKKIPEIIGGRTAALRSFIHEYLFVSLFRACAESLASENASRLASMQRAEKNIDELLEELNTEYHRLRQSGIDEELFDVIAGFEALSDEDR
jgi:F-type H+-transporting ATPase subunit gamma